jgi:hypothetical protein
LAGTSALLLFLLHSSDESNGPTQRKMRLVHVFFFSDVASCPYNFLFSHDIAGLCWYDHASHMKERVGAVIASCFDVDCAFPGTGRVCEDVGSRSFEAFVFPWVNPASHVERIFHDDSVYLPYHAYDFLVKSFV